MFCVMWHFGDWMSDTSILSATEKGVYFDVIAIYYKEERPITRDECNRLSRAYALHEQEALEYVLKRFFIEEDGAFRHRRCDEEITKAKASKERRRNAANARWALNSNGKEKKSSGEEQSRKSNAESSLMQSKCNASAMDMETINHKPLTNNHIDVVNDTTCHMSEETSDDGLFGEEQVQKPEHSGVPNCPTQKIVDLYHQILPELPKVTLITSARQTLTRSRWRDLYGAKDFETMEQGLEVFKTYFEIVKSRDFLMGRCKPSGGREVPFRATYDWLMKQGNFMKVCEGNYVNSRRK